MIIGFRLKIKRGNREILGANEMGYESLEFHFLILRVSAF